MAAYLYVEPYEVRQEIIVRPRDLQAWLDLGLENRKVIPIEDQEQLKTKVVDFLASKNPVTINGAPARGRLDRIHFIRRTLRTTGIIEPPEELDVTSATLGVIFVYPIEQLPNKVAMKWELFATAIQSVPAVASDEAGGLPTQLTPDEPVLKWNNYLTNPTVPGLQSIARPASRRIRVPLISALCAGAMLLLGVRLILARCSNHSSSNRLVVPLLTIGLAGIATLPVVRIGMVNPFAPKLSASSGEARQLVAGLLHNVYRAFDHHDHNLIYDSLSQSISGELLDEVYLETRRSMEVKNQGGLRVTVKEIVVSELQPLDIAQADGLGFRCRWRVAGWIGHWGHIHSRVNEHLANMTLTPLDGRWKISALEMLDEQPIQSPQLSAAIP